ncbi:MAG: ATP-dependent DNA helicase chl1 [Icmadophila ericetorum]|nr:ATP-dependent DNA helicase chl1 [Icmadophila ericetorum]
MASDTKDFHHPYQPYDIQLDFMEALYECIEQGKIKGEHEANIPNDPELSSEPSWVVKHAEKERRKAFLQKKLDFENRLARIRAKELRQKQRDESGESNRKRIKLDRGPGGLEEADMDASYLLGDYESGDEAHQATLSKDSSSAGGVSAKTFDLLNKLGMILRTPTEEDDLQSDDLIKIFYCSRTHSQLTQFANEVRRVKIPPQTTSTSEPEQPEVDSPSIEEIKYLSLGSRKNLCINHKVSRLGSTTAINEKCLELQQQGTSKDHKCGYLPTQENKSLVSDFRDHSLAKVRDIEDLGNLGRELGICPYYASRASINRSEVVALPYPLLLQKTARETLDISVRGHVVIIDEAHNLMDAISGIYSSTVTLSILRQSRTQIGLYLQKFRNKLKGKNRVYVTQVVRLIDSLITYLDDKLANTKSSDGTANLGDLLTGKGVDQINLYKLDRYLKLSKLARKVDGYSEHTSKSDKSKEARTKSATPVLTHVHNFLETLTNPAVEGQFFYSRTESGDMSLKYMLLDPTHYFKEIVEEARAVILSGGTMSPMEDYINHLLPYVHPSRISTLSCGHVIPPQNLLVRAVVRGPRNIEFEFTFEKRNLSVTIDELGRCIEQLSQVIPDGLVIFFPSYAYLQQCTTRWKVNSGQSICIWDQISATKKMFSETKDGPGVDDVLQEYSATIETGNGALLLSVVGGKMSEGINFSDKLGRGIIIVGMPFPNIQSAEWKAKLSYIEKSTVGRGGSIADGKKAARDFYENACMRAVNQSIGRAIRHRNDYACILMLDQRYDTQRIKTKLPGWIQKGLVQHGEGQLFNAITSNLVDFFKSEKTS